MFTKHYSHLFIRTDSSDWILNDLGTISCSPTLAYAHFLTITRSEKDFFFKFRERAAIQRNEHRDATQLVMKSRPYLEGRLYLTLFLLSSTAFFLLLLSFTDFFFNFDFKHYQWAISLKRLRSPRGHDFGTVIHGFFSLV